MDGTVGKITQLTQRPSEEWLKRYREGVIDMAQAVTEAYEGEEEKVNTIEFYAEVAKVQTTVDGVRVVLDLGEPGVKVMAALTECKQKGVVLDVKAVPKPN